MSFLKVYIHFVWSTKNRFPLLATPEVRHDLWYHMRDNASKKGIFIDTISGYYDHCHCLVSLGAQQTLSNMMQLIKGESSHWINKNKLCRSTFEWQDDYYAASVSPQELDAVRQYVKDQEHHHQHQSFQEEIDGYLAEWGFQRTKDGSIAVYSPDL